MLKGEFASFQDGGSRACSLICERYEGAGPPFRSTHIRYLPSMHSAPDPSTSPSDHDGDLDAEALVEFLVGLRDEVDTEEGRAEDEEYLAGRLNALFDRFHDYLLELAERRLSTMRAAGTGGVLSGSSAVSEYFLYAKRNPRKVLGLNDRDAGAMAVRRVFLGGFYRALHHRSIDRMRKQKADRMQEIHSGLAQTDIDAGGIALSELLSALEELAQRSERKAEIARMKLLGDPTVTIDSPSFVRMPQKDIARVLGISERLVEQEWALAKQWLQKRLPVD